MGLIGFLAELAVLGCIAAGIAANAAVVGTCEMLKLGRNAGYIGPWRADIEGSGCQAWDKDDTDLNDWRINMARACCMMALIFGIILAVYGFFHQCLCPLPCSQKILDLSGLGVQIGLLLTWPMIRSDVCDEFGGCSWGSGSTWLVFAQIFYFIASIFTRCMREPRYQRRRNEEEKEEPQEQATERV